ncbi:hypothetical protein J6590_072210 [Homalodisca vitripennis]|nr:hypothetical protein J6590_072210 [Homalodisca vitripennis]
MLKPWVEETASTSLTQTVVVPRSSAIEEIRVNEDDSLLLSSEPGLEIPYLIPPDWREEGNKNVLVSDFTRS